MADRSDKSGHHSRHGRRGYGRDGGSRHSHKRPAQPELTVDENSPVIQMFRQCQVELDARHDKHERIVKLSRDITIESKRTIGELQRLVGNDKPEEVIERATQKLAWIRSHRWVQVARELHGEDPYKFLRAYSPGLQEYVEAVSFFHYLTKQDLVTLSQLEKQLIFLVDLKKFDEKEKEHSSKNRRDSSSHHPSDSASDNPTETQQAEPEPKPEPDTAASQPDLKTLTEIHIHIPPTEYMLGICDLTGEMMRMAIISVGKGDFDTPFKAVEFMRLIHDSFASFGNVGREMNQKLRVLRQSTQKVETACYNLQVRASEIPKEMLVELFSEAPHGERDSMGEGYGGGSMD